MTYIISIILGLTLGFILETLSRVYKRNKLNKNIKRRGSYTSRDNHNQFFSLLSRKEDSRDDS